MYNTKAYAAASATSLLVSTRIRRRDVIDMTPLKAGASNRS